jgi:glutathione synthase/RimK-type ligase-like ATP-grasp enzyme
VLPQPLRGAGFDVLRTLAVAGAPDLRSAARELPAPFIAKHNQGGKGTSVRLFTSHDEFDAYLSWPAYPAPVDGITLPIGTTQS